jgi:hypothetical protein
MDAFSEMLIDNAFDEQSIHQARSERRLDAKLAKVTNALDETFENLEFGLAANQARFTTTAQDEIHASFEKVFKRPW